MLKSNTTKEEQEAILNAISKHPNTKFAKLFREVDDSPSQKNIVLLLIELTQQKEFYVNFNVSLQYFLNLYEKLDANNKEFLFNEAGLLIFNATQIYSRRVDCVQERLENQLAELSKGEEFKDNENNNKCDTEKPEKEKKEKRRKRLIENTDISEIEIVSRKYRKLAAEKRFSSGTKLDTMKILTTNLHTENYTHPAMWKYSDIIDKDNDELDSKRNYRLFTSHVEHRYNTLMPDINFLLYYKMKDYIEDEEGEFELCQDSSDWPPLSHAYLKRYLKLEDQAFANDKSDDKDRFKPLVVECCNTKDNVKLDAIESKKEEQQSFSKMDSGIGTSLFESSVECQEPSLLDLDTSVNMGEIDSLLEREECMDESEAAEFLTLQERQKDSTTQNIENETAHVNLDETLNADILLEGTSPVLQTESNDVAQEDNNLKNNAAVTENQKTAATEENVNKTLEIIVHIENNKKENCVSSDKSPSCSSYNDEGVYFSDIDESPSPITIQLELNSITEEKEEDKKEVYIMPKEVTPTEWPIELNILKFPQNVLKKMRRKLLLTNLGEEMELFLKARSYKRTRFTAPPVETSKVYRVTPNWNDFAPLSPCSSIDDLLGFDESGVVVSQPKSENNEKIDLRLSRDSGVGYDLVNATIATNLTEELNVNLEGNNGIEILDNILLTPACSERSNGNPSNENNEVSDVTKSSETALPIINEAADCDSTKMNEHIELSANIAAKIQKWHKHLQPILANSAKRHHFDVFEIGTNIINEFHNSDNKITFQDVMNHQDPSYVSRYFLSTLLLANQGNLELSVNNKSDSNPSEWRDVQLKLISKTRHVVAMEDNIGLPSSCNKQTTRPEVNKIEIKSPQKKRCSTVNVNRIELVKPIAKVMRKSEDYDSGIFSNDDSEFT